MASTPCQIKSHWKKVLIILSLVRKRDVTEYYVLTLMSFLEQSIKQEGASHFPAIKIDNRVVHIFLPSFGLKVCRVS